MVEYKNVISGIRLKVEGKATIYCPPGTLIQNCEFVGHVVFEDNEGNFLFETGGNSKGDFSDE